MKPLIQIIALLLFNSTAFFTIAAEEEKPAGEPTAQYHLPNIPNKRASLLLEHMTLMGREDEVVSLNNAEEEFYGLFLPQANGQPQGGILILHDEQQHGHWPDIIGPLREYLPQFGWSTLTIELPDKLKRQRIPRTLKSETLADNSELADSDNNPALAQNLAESGNDEADKEDITKEAKDNDGLETAEPAKIEDELTQTTEDEGEPALPRLDKLPDLPVKETETLTQEEVVIDLIADYQAKNRQRIKAAIDYLQQQNQFNLIIIGFGHGASWAIDYVHQQVQQEEPKGLTLITIDTLPNPYDKDLINQQLVDISLPYLDLLQSQTHAIDKTAAKRLAIMRRNGNPNSQQIFTQEISSYHELENPTNRRIRGWIKSNASGSQVAIKP